MSLPDGFEWAYPGAFPEQWCVRRTGARLMLCGRALHPAHTPPGFVPVVQPADPEPVHERCAALVADLHGVCPVCGGDFATLAGRIVEHGVWIVGRDGMERSDKPCAGAGQVPEAAS